MVNVFVSSIRIRILSFDLLASANATRSSSIATHALQHHHVGCPPEETLGARLELVLATVKQTVDVFVRQSYPAKNPHFQLAHSEIQYASAVHSLQHGRASLRAVFGRWHIFSVCQGRG